MHRALRTYILGILLMIFAVSVAVAQIPTTNRRQENYIPPVGLQKDYNEDKDSKSDTTNKKKRERKPLESVFFDDSTRMLRIFSWMVNPEYNTIRRTDVDTLLGGRYQTDYNFMATDGGIGSAYLGNLGSAVMPLNYFSRPSAEGGYSFLKVWEPFLLRPRDVVFYNAKMPYSRITYSMSGQVKVEENQFHAIISHNISPSTSMNLVYNAESTKGLYMNQGTMDRYFAASVSHTGKRYSIHGGYIYNHGSINENGGIRDDREVTDTVLMSENQVNVWLQKANNTYRSHTYWWTQSYGIPLRKQREDELTIQKIPSIYIGQEFEYSIFKKKYTATGDTIIFKETFMDLGQSADSIAQEMIDVKAFVQLQPYNREGALGLISGGIGNEFSTYYYYVPDEYKTQYGAGGVNARNTLYLYGGLEGKVSKYFDWNASVRYNLVGYKAGDFMGLARIRLSAYTKKQKPITLDASLKLSLTEPDFWAQSYFSNHFAWRNSFTKESTMQASAKFSVPSINFYLGADYALTTGKVYYDAQSKPSQFGDALSVLAVYAQKDFRAGGFHFNHRVLFQVSSSQEVAPVPLISAYANYYFGFDVVKDVLNMQIGVEGRYQTSYFGFAYNPAISQFYNQREKQLGGYPYLDAFVSAKWKRMRILVKLQHFNENLIGSRDYFMVLHQPQNRMMLKFKFSWSFYD